MKTYRRVRKDYPKGVLGIYDNGGKTVDRYTVVYEPDDCGNFPYVGMSSAPFHPQGFGQHGELPRRYTRQSGERVLEFLELPPDCQKLVLQDLSGVDIVEGRKDMATQETHVMGSDGEQLVCSCGWVESLDYRAGSIIYRGHGHSRLSTKTGEIGGPHFRLDCDHEDCDGGTLTSYRLLSHA